MLAREGQRFGQLFFVEEIRFGHHEQQPIARRSQDPLLEKLPLRRGQDLGGIEQEDGGVGAGQIPVGDFGPLLVDVVDARGIDDGEVILQQRRGVGELHVVDAVALLALDGQPIGEAGGRDGAALAGFGDRGGLRLGPVADVREQRGGGRDAGRQHGRAEERVDEGRFAVIELAEDDDGVTLVVELGQTDIADVAIDEGQPRPRRQLAEIDEHAADGGLLLVQRRPSCSSPKHRQQLRHLGVALFLRRPRGQRFRRGARGPSRTGQASKVGGLREQLQRRDPLRQIRVRATELVEPPDPRLASSICPRYSSRLTSL